MMEVKIHTEHFPMGLFCVISFLNTNNYSNCRISVAKNIQIEIQNSPYEKRLVYHTYLKSGATVEDERNKLIHQSLREISERI